MDLPDEHCIGGAPEEDYELLGGLFLTF
jgi:hypothetical protein